MSEIEVLYRDANPPEAPFANWPGFQPGTTTLPAGSVHSEGGLPLPVDIILDRDVEVTLRDGTTIYVDVYRPTAEGPFPAVMAWSPYGKQGGFWTLDQIPGRAGVPASQLSGLQKFEGPDPAFWCAQGYVIVNPDARGAYESHGDIQTWSRLEGQDGADVVEWIAVQPWSTGKVALAGNSWLAVSQWIIASERPEHLAAIAPWEGLSDVYRDLLAPGGIPWLGFTEGLTQLNVGRNRVEDLVAMIQAHPFFDDYWRTKDFDTSGITVPAYVVASWTNELHTRGTFAAWSRLRPETTWLRVNNTMEWPDFYAYQHDLLRFFDHVLKDTHNGWEDTPHIRLSILDPGHDDDVEVPADAVPPTAAVATRLYLDASNGSISTEEPAGEAQVSYAADSGSAVFSGDLGDLTIVGPMRLRLWIEATGHDDADLFVGVSKIGVGGTQLVPDWIPGVPTPGARGQLRASHRDLDDDATDLVPRHRHTVSAPLQPGEVVPVDVEIWPMGMRWHAGERLRIEVSGRDLQMDIPGIPVHPTENTGTHTLHTGGSRSSFLLAPVVLSGALL